MCGAGRRWVDGEVGWVLMNLFDIIAGIFGLACVLVIVWVFRLFLSGNNTRRGIKSLRDETLDSIEQKAVDEWLGGDDDKVVSKIFDAWCEVGSDEDMGTLVGVFSNPEDTNAARLRLLRQVVQQRREREEAEMRAEKVRAKELKGRNGMNGRIIALGIIVVFFGSVNLVVLLMRTGSLSTPGFVEKMKGNQEASESEPQKVGESPSESNLSLDDPQKERWKALQRAKENLGSSDANVRYRAVEVIKDLEGKELIADIFAQCLREDISWVISGLLVMVGDWGNASMIPRLIELRSEASTVGLGREINTAIQQIKNHAGSAEQVRGK